MSPHRPAPSVAGPPGAARVPGLAAKLAFLRQPASYPDPTSRVAVLETHMSWVFLLDRHVYKLKKPVCYELLDFRGLAARRFFCEEELRLNRRLAPDVYLDVLPLTCDGHGRLALGGAAPAIDYLVRMRRLAHERMLDFQLLHGGAADADLTRLAQTLAAFHAARPREALDGLAYRARLAADITLHTAELAAPAYAQPSALLESLRDGLLASLAALAPVLDARAQAGRIVEGHGDLRPEHVYLGEPLAVIDCLEFARPLRVLDGADEVAFLALECERLGARAAGDTLLAAYARQRGDHAPPALLHFYRAARAVMRALIAARHLRDPHLRHSPHWLQRTALYLDLAKDHLALARPG